MVEIVKGFPKMRKEINYDFMNFEDQQKEADEVTEFIETKGLKLDEQIIKAFQDYLKLKIGPPSTSFDGKEIMPKLFTNYDRIDATVKQMIKQEFKHFQHVQQNQSKKDQLMGRRVKDEYA